MLMDKGESIALCLNKISNKTRFSQHSADIEAKEGEYVNNWSLHKYTLFPTGKND